MIRCFILPLNTTNALPLALVPRPRLASLHWFFISYSAFISSSTSTPPVQLFVVRSNHRNEEVCTIKVVLLRTEDLPLPRMRRKKEEVYQSQPRVLFDTLTKC